MATRPASRPPIRPNWVVNDYATLLKAVRNAGLLRRRRGFYITLLVVLMLVLTATWSGFAFLGNSWFQLLIAGGLGVIATQFGLFAHEAAHHQVFSSKPVNEWFGRIIGVVLVGFSYAFWIDKHSRHHTNPNRIGKDPDIESNAVAFYGEAARSRTGFMGAVVRRQGYLLFPMLPFLGMTLTLDSFRFLLRKNPVQHRWLELSVLTARSALFVGVVFWFLPLGMAFAFVGLQLGMFGFYMGISFAPNHKGMPILERTARVDFLRRQVLTSRNISGGVFVTGMLGGLNYQVEHHLFPDMARPNLRKAARMVVDYCQEHNITYTETTLLNSYAIVVRYLNHVGLRAADPFECPLASQLGR